MVFVWKQNYILVDEYFFFCCTWIVNSADKNASRSGWHFAFRMYTMRQKSYATAASTSTGTITLA
ncbi:hypothetical protein DBZ47_14045 [Escherichia coli]|nr:hypothetical protein DBZ47_14045 [Escherichia coli]